MKKLILSAAVSLFLILSIDGYAQKQKNIEAQESTKQQPPIIRCGTMEAFEKSLQLNPDFKAQWEAKMKATANAELPQGQSSPSRLITLTGPVTIPVIVHVVLPNPSIITEEQIDFLLKQLNICYNGLNADSSNGASFYNVRGHSLIRFARARRDPNGNLSNGVERKVGNVPITATTYQAIKHSSQDGLDPWDITKYYNLWVGDAGTSGLLGIAPGVGVGGQTETTSSPTGIDGICVDYRGFSNGCYSYPQFAQAKTVVHEIGHNFGLFHNFSGCSTGDDFIQLTPTGQSLPNALLAAADDTPSQSTATSGCPSGVVASNCTTVANPPGKMYQTYMDYTDDPCYSMFSKGQVARMEYVLEYLRPGYLTTNGATPPSSVPSLDITPASVVSPGGSEFDVANCNIISYPLLTCAGAFTPKVTVYNNGSSTITSLTIKAEITNSNGTASVTRTVTGLNLLTDRSVTIDLQSTLNLAIGSNLLKFTTSAPNGSVDQVPGNDILSTTITIAGPTSLPLSNDFESNVFPGMWTIYNPDNNNTWVRKAPGNNSGYALFINNFSNNTPGQTDDFRSPPVIVNPQDSVVISFDLAYKNFSDPPFGNYDDTLAVLISKDCGASFTTVYKKWGAVLSTAGGSNAAYLTPVAGDWRTDRVAIGGALLSGGAIQVVFRMTNRYGNNLFIDNISIAKKSARDLQLLSIVSPSARQCTSNLTPQAIVKNVGEETVNSFRVGYRIDNGAIVYSSSQTTLDPGASVSINLPSSIISTTGNKNFTAFVTDVVGLSGIGDLVPANDTLRKLFTMVALTAPPLSEGFEGTFPPAGWSVMNFNAGTATWVQKVPGRNSNFSAFINNYDINYSGTLDDLRTPAMEIAPNRDSVIFSFDLAHKNYPDSNYYETLSVLASVDCGNTFTPIYSKTGPALATAGSSDLGYLNPIASDWRRETITVGGSLVASNNIAFYIRNKSGYGNNVFVDNVSIQALSRRDIQLVGINLPALYTCSPDVHPNVTIKNTGIETITAFKVAYTIDGSAPVTTVFNGVRIERDASVNVNLNTGTLNGTGAHQLFVYAFEPTSASGTGDLYPKNDSLHKTVSLSGTQPAPLTENFVNPVFPPANWVITNEDNDAAWKRSETGNGNAGSAFLNSYAIAGSHRSELITPVITYSGVDSINLSFDLAAVSRYYPGTTGIPLDTLEVLATSNCGNSYQTVYKKWGQDLQTISDINFPYTFNFVPGQKNQWRTERLDLSSFAGNPSVQLLFRASTNNGNNIYLDNISVKTRILPPLLKARGYIVLPNPFTNRFTIWHYRTPTTLKYVNVYDAKGQLVWSRSFNSNAERTISVDLSGQPAGVYLVNIGYEDEYRNASERVIKR